MKIVFFGTSEFASIILSHMMEHSLAPTLVVTTPDKPMGRKQVVTPPSAKVTAENYSLPVIQPPILDEGARTKIQEAKPDLFVVASYGKILSKDILDIPTRGALNVHPSLLPKYRGPSPIQSTILRGEARTGVTIIQMDEKMDHGPIVAQRQLPETVDRMYYLDLHDKLASLGGLLLADTIPEWVNGDITPYPQTEELATYTTRFTKADGKIDWNQAAIDIERRVRALDPWPGAHTIVPENPKMDRQKTLKILRARAASPEQRPQDPGTIFVSNSGELGVYTGDGEALMIETLQLEGKRPVPSTDFLLGYSELIGITLG